MTMPLSRPLSLYRTLLQSARIAFEGDAPLLLSSRQRIRSEFEANRDLSPTNDVALMQEKLKHGDEVAKFLRENLVQGRLEKDAKGDERYKLRIHEHTERRDNGAIDVDFATGGGCGSGGGTKKTQAR